MTPQETIGAYYDALRAGEPLGPFFTDRPDVVKVGISDRLVGPETVVEALRDQTRTTTDWHVESRDLRTDRRDAVAWFADLVRLEWTRLEDRRRYAFDSRWSGTLERADDWRFVGMHVSAPHDLEAEST